MFRPVRNDIRVRKIQNVQMNGLTVSNSLNRQNISNDVELRLISQNKNIKNILKMGMKMNDRVLNKSVNNINMLNENVKMKLEND